MAPLAFAAFVLGGCDPEIAPPFEVEGTGGVEGRVFYDADEDGVYSPTAGDTALSDIQLVVRERSTEQTFNDATVTTDDDGRFNVTDLPLGTHDLFIDTLTAPPSLRFCQNPLPVSIYDNEMSFEAVSGQASCLITVAEAEALAPDVEYVTVAGVVTSSPDQITGGYTYVQDETGGVLVFGTLDPAIEVGDYIEVSGTSELYFGTVEITSPVLKNRIPAYGEVEPTVVETAEIASDAPDFEALIQSLLVTVEAAELTTPFGGFENELNSRNAKINDGSGQTEIRIYDGVVEESGTLNDLVTVGNCYDITGLTGQFSSTGQIYPRTLDDIEEVPCN